MNAGNAITAFSLLLYALTFNLKERTSRSFAVMMACVTLVYFFDVLASTSTASAEIGLWLRFQWLGIAFIPMAYLHLSLALLETTNGSSSLLQRILLTAGAGIGLFTFLGVMFTDYITGEVIFSGRASYLQPGPLFWVFLAVSGAIMGLSGRYFFQAYGRCRTPTSRRRMFYLLGGAVGPILGVFPFLMIGGRGLAGAAGLFWGSVALSTILVAVLLVLMAYSIAYYGISSPDRVVKTRLAQWLIRGPVVASAVLAASIVVGRVSEFFGFENSRLVPFTIVAVLLLLQFLITLIKPSYERFLFWTERDELLKFSQLEDRLLTSRDMRQYLEAVLDAVCDISGSRASFLGVTEETGIEVEVSVGSDDAGIDDENIPSLIHIQESRDLPIMGRVFIWNGYLLIPLRDSNEAAILGVLGLHNEQDNWSEFSGTVLDTLQMLRVRITTALKDRILQREVLGAVDRLVSKAGEVQEMRAAATYTGSEAFSKPVLAFSTEADLVKLVKDALGHYWGGPRLTDNPLMRLRIVARVTEEGDGNPVNGLRSILRRAMERVKPEGEKKLTAEWLLYNILEMKFIEGRKVRDIAMKLSVSEADLYRKQRIAIREIARAIAEMEHEVLSSESEEQEDSNLSLHNNKK